MLENGGSPLAWHSKWRADAKLQPSDAGVSTHELSCKLLQTMVCYDQLDIGNLAAAEIIARQLQIVEEKWKDRFTGKDDGLEMSLYSGYSGTGRGQLCICPALNEWVAEELK
eukprot:12275871-Karenia_brevis.AAC.1